MNFQQALKFLETLPDMERGRIGSGATMSVDSMKKLLEILHHPERQAKTIHITGSKGKGSTAAFIASILQAHGCQTAVFTSPHLHSYTERIVINGQAIGEQEFADGIEEIAQTIKDSAFSAIGPVSTFGILTALFFVTVAKRASSDRSPINWQVVEVGLGGKEDATNVFASKAVAVITPISLEHTAILGNDTSKIALQKAGIITQGAKVVMAPQRDAGVVDVIKARCENVGAELINVAERFQYEHVGVGKDGQFFTVSQGSQSTNYEIALGGVHQITNAVTALAVSETLNAFGTAVDETSKRAGLKRARLPGRFECFPDPVSSTSGKSRTIVIDGAHNDDSARALAQALKLYFANEPCIVVLSLNQDKNVEAFWRELGPSAQALVVTKTGNPRSLEPKALAERISSAQTTTAICQAVNVGDALTRARALLPEGGVICVTGSLYLVAEAREVLVGQ